MNKNKNALVLFVMLAILALASSCESLSSLTIGFESGGSPGGSPGRHPGSLPAPQRLIGAFQNNSSVHLDSGTFRGNFTINANQVTLSGRGTSRTVIDGDVRIEGNNCVIRQLRIRGNVYITGNNADLRGVVVEGRVFTSGRDHRLPRTVRPPRR